MKSTFPPRPVWNPEEHNPYYRAEAFQKFREAERAWFETLLAHPHVKEVMNIPEDEPIFVLRAKDTYASAAVADWLTHASRPHDKTRGISLNKYVNANTRFQEMLEWQRVNWEEVKVPD